MGAASFDFLGGVSLDHGDPRQDAESWEQVL